MRPSPQRPHCADASVPLPPTGLLRSVRKEQCPTGFLPEARIHPVSRPEGERRADLRHQERTARRPTRQRRATSRWLRCLRCSPSWSRPSTARPRRSERWPSRGSARCTRSPAGRHAEEETSPIAHRPSPDLVRFERFTEGRCAQILHVGPYDDEAATLDRLHGDGLPGTRTCSERAAPRDLSVRPS